MILHCSCGTTWTVQVAWQNAEHVTDSTPSTEIAFTCEDCDRTHWLTVSPREGVAS